MLVLSAAVLLVVSATAARGQSALDGFDPNANGTIVAIVVQPDGKILLGGQFGTVLGVTRNNIARLNADGTLDTTFNPNANALVSSIAVQADGKILVGGNFSSIGGQTRSGIARLDAMAGLADSFDPSANGTVNSIAVQADGKILAGGDFTTIAGQTRNLIARLDPATGLADSFDPNAGGDCTNIVGFFCRVNTIAVQADGKILVGGNFTTIGGQTRNRIARLDPATGFADSFNPNASSIVYTIVVQADGKILVGGFFTNIGGQNRHRIARLNATTGLVDSFNPNASSYVYTIVVQADGKILVGGFFSGANSIGGQTRNRIARLDPVTGLADSFDPNADGQIISIAMQADGKILLGGDLMSLAPNGGGAVTRNHIARLETDGRLDQTLDLGTVGNYFLVTAVQPDGKILVGGAFTTILGVPRNNIARLNTDGTLDTAFNPNANDYVSSISVQADGKILVGGQFNGANSIGGQTRNYIARLDAITGLADSFDPNANNFVYTIAVQADGKILVGGNFSVPFGTNTIGGQTRNHIARLDATTGLADSFDPNASGEVFTFVVQADGKILVGGGFVGVDSIGGQRRDFIARLDPTTGLPDSFDPHASSAVYSIAVQSDGKVLAGGYFTTIGGQTRNRIARLDATTGLADSFDPNANNLILTIALQADGKVLAAGTFTSIGGQTRNRIARLGNDTAALQNLAATPTTITWTRGGSSPQFTRVAFEYSTDDVNYTPLGSGTATGSNWTLTGLNLPTGQNFYIRARGYYRSGNTNSSESIAESVRNAFIPRAPTPSQVVSRKLHTGVPRDINLPLTGPLGIECRSGGANNDYQVVFTFASAVTFNGASVTAGVGVVSGSSGNVTNTITVNLTGVTNAQKITVTLVGVNDGAGTGDVGVPMGVLVGDTNGNGTVNASDVGQTKGQVGQIVTSLNFRTDVNANGTINATDVSLVKARIGTSIPTAAEGIEIVRDSEK